MKKLSFLILCMMVLASCSQSDVTKESSKDSESVENVIMARRSIRQYTKQTISRDTLDQIIKCGINAPNGQNRQAYEIRIVNNPQMLKDISDAVIKDNRDLSLKPGADNIFFGATTVVFIGNDTSYDMSQIDCGLLGENIMLSAWEKGIGSCCMAFPIRLMKESETCAPLIQKLGFSAGYNLLYCIAMGYPNENPDAKPIFHSDRGFQYTSKVFQWMLQEQGITQSMSRVGHCIDNGPTEGFWGIVKAEMYNLRKFNSEEDLRSAIEDFIRYYNEGRYQARFGYQAPAEVRAAALSSTEPAQYPIPENRRIQEYKQRYVA